MSERPTMLMISHCVPDESGNSDQRQAWRLLSQVGRTHRISLICLMGAPVRLSQWRKAFSRTDRMVVLRHGRRHRAHRALDAQVTTTISRWRGDVGFDAVLATDPQLWGAAEICGATDRICDFTASLSNFHRGRIAQAPSGWRGAITRWWHRRVGVRHDLHERHVARNCGLIIVGDYDVARRYVTEPCNIAVTVDALDLTAGILPKESKERPLRAA